MSWRTRRWWPSRIGWALLSIPLCVGILTVTVALESVFAPSVGSLPPTTCVAILLASVAATAAIIELLPICHQRTTATWTLTLEPEEVSLEERPAGQPAKYAAIYRSEAGRIDIPFVPVKDRGGTPTGYYLVQQVTGFSLDRETSITLTPRRVRVSGLTFVNPADA